MRRRIAAFISRNGADLQCLIDACADYQIKGSVDFVMSDDQDAIGLKRADNAGIPNMSYDADRFESIDAFYATVKEELHLRHIDWILLIEYQQTIPDWFYREFEGKIISCDPSPVPLQRGDLSSGIELAEKSIYNGDKYFGCTIVRRSSFDDANNEILAQEIVPIFSTDQPLHLYNRIRKAEHYIIPKVFSALCSDE